MPVPSTVNEFIDVVRKSGLVGEEKLRPELDRWGTDVVAPATPEQAASALLNTGVITRFQARQFKLGRYKRFTIAGKYRLLELLGVGGMGAVYLCEHVFMKRLVAIKVLPIEKLADPSNLERFYREARAVAALDHPNIVRAYDIDKADNLHFLVMEYVDGTSLQEIVARYGPLDATRAAHYIAQAAVGMHHGHLLSLVHRDIKPGNLLLDRTGVIKLLDMGLARFFNDKNDNLTAKYDDSCVLGTADYLAPEQAISNVVDIRADIYALGGTFYFMLTGQSPVPEGTVAAKLVFHQASDPKPVTDFRDDVPPGMLAILRKMLKKKPNDRYQTPLEVAEALAEWAHAEVENPPVREMPDLCPAVMVLSGHSNTAQKIGASARQSGAGYGALAVITRGAGSSVQLAKPGIGSEPLTPGNESFRIEDTTQATVPTGRSTNTQPIPSNGPRPALPDLLPLNVPLGDDDSGVRVSPYPKESRTYGLEPPNFTAPVMPRRGKPWLPVAVGLLILALISGGAAWYFTKPKSGGTASETVIAGEEASRFIGQDRTVQFTVADVSGGGDVQLNSLPDQQSRQCLVVILGPDVIQGLANADIKALYNGRTVRATGKLYSRNSEGSPGLTVSKPNQIQIVNDR